MIKEVLSDYHDIPETFNRLFANIVLNSKIIPNGNFENTENPVRNAIIKFKNDPSFKMII